MEDRNLVAAVDEAAKGESTAASAVVEDDAKYGFGREEMGKELLAGTVMGFDRHLFLRYESPDLWPSNIEAAGSDWLPGLLASELKARKNDIKKRPRLTVCGDVYSTETSDGDVLIFPDMIRYRGLTHSDISNFIEEVLVKETEWLPGTAEKLTGSYVFVCAHGSRDKRCGVCGPSLIEKFKEDIVSSGLQGQVFVSPCSHIGGHKYAGNIIIFSPNTNGEVSGHWYGYVTPDDVPALVEQHIGNGVIIDRLWRGQMGLSREDQKKAQSLRLLLNEVPEEKKGQEIMQSTSEVAADNNITNSGFSCCQGVGNSSCCQVKLQTQKPKNNSKGEQPPEKECDGICSSSEGSCVWKIGSIPKWFESWEREDTYAALAVVAAIASVAVGYSCYKQWR